MGKLMFDDREYQDPEPINFRFSEPPSINLKVAASLMAVFLLAVISLQVSHWEPGLVHAALIGMLVLLGILADILRFPKWIQYGTWVFAAGVAIGVVLARIV